MAAPSGNKNAKKAKDWERELRTALHFYEAPDVPKGQALSKIVQKVVKAAVDGNWDAITEIGNRLDGKPAQSIDVSGDMTVRNANELSDAELAAIAAGRGAGTADTTDSPPEPPDLH